MTHVVLNKARFTIKLKAGESQRTEDEYLRYANQRLLEKYGLNLYGKYYPKYNSCGDIHIVPSLTYWADSSVEFNCIVVDEHIFSIIMLEQPEMIKSIETINE